MRRRAGGARRRAAPQRGFTLIELMIALVVSSLLVGMIFAIFIRMSVAYRGQQQIAELQNRLAAARAKLEYDARHAGLGIADGFTIMSTGANLHAPITIGNNSNGPDTITFFYADPSLQVPTTTAGGTCNNQQCDGLGPTAGFSRDDLVLAVTPSTTTASPYAGDANIATFSACVLQLENLTGNSFTFYTSNLWGNGVNAHCPTPVKGTTIYYRFVAHAWRIDPDRPELGALQYSPSGDLVGNPDWQDQAYGFTDIQIATRFYERGDVIDTPDPDTDPERDWYSDGTQATRTSPQLGPLVPPIQISISLVARTERDVEGVASSTTPNLTDPDNPANNTIGDHPAVPLPSTDPALAGNRVYRYTTFQVDLRNIGVGR